MKIEKELGTIAALRELINGFDYGEALVILPKGKDDIELRYMHWEFIPEWIRDAGSLTESRKKGIPLLNATAEKLLSSKMFKDAALKRRCLVPASHFYDWRHYKIPGEKKETAFPYCVKLKDTEYFYMAAIWQPWTDKETGEHLETFAIVTTEANNIMSRVHNKKHRMPVILTEEFAYEWIFADLSEERIHQIASFQYPSEEMDAYTIRKDFKITDDPLAAFEYEMLPSLNY
ncbi:MAG: SOS response-associated peptidase [Ferruginibacter sp.]